MASKSESQTAIVAFLAATSLSAALWWLGSGVTPQWWATWLAPLPVLIYAMRAGARTAFAAAFLAWAIGGLNIVSYSQMVHAPAAIIVLAIAGPALAFALATLLARALALRGRVIAAAIAVPSVWVAVEFVNAITSPHGTFYNLAYTQMDVLPIVQLAAVFGAWGIGFLVMLVPAAAAVAATARTKADRTKPAVFALALLVAALGYGVLRLHAADSETTSTVRIGLASLEGPARPLLTDEKGQKLLDRYLPVLESLANDGATIAIIPETVFKTTSIDIPAIAEIAKRRGITIVSGVDYLSGTDGERNLSIAFAPSGDAPAHYSKHHLLPAFESRYTPGDAYQTIDAPSRTGLAICKDMDFPAMGRAYAERDAKLLLVPAWDFEVDGWLHSRMAILRGVESGFAIARVARDGVLTLSDDRGRVVAEASSTGITDAATLIGNLPLRQTRTLYARLGDWFGWLSLAGLVACIALLFAPRRRA